MVTKMWLSPGSVNCTCCEDIPWCRNTRSVIDIDGDSPDWWTSDLMVYGIAIIGTDGQRIDPKDFYKETIQ